MPNLSNRIVASNCGPMKPRGVAWNGAGGWVIFSQSRQVNFSRTVSMTLKRRGISSSVLVTSSPIFASCDPPQQAQLVGASMTTRSCSMSSGQGLRTGRLRGEDAHGLRLRRRGLRGKLILARRGDEFFKFQFQLLDQPRRALGARPVQFAFELLDPQLEMRDQRLIVRQLRPRVGRFGLPIDGFGLYPADLRRGRIAFDLDPQPRFAFSPQRLTFDQQRRLGAGKIRRKIIRLQTHEASESDFPVDSIAECYPTRVGRKVS